MIFREGRMVFFHPGKTGGTSIEKSLTQHFGLPEQSHREYDPTHAYGWDEKNRAWAQHATHDDMLARGYITAREMDSFFRFTFVRHPLDRAVSTYVWNCKKNSFAERFPTFRDFVYAAFRDQIAMPRLGNHLQPQKDFALHSHFVGRFENFESDFTELCRRRDLPSLTLTRENASRPERDNWRTYYTRELALIVTQFYKADFDLFRYEVWL